MSSEEKPRFELRLWNHSVSAIEIIADLKRVAQWNTALTKTGLSLSNRHDIKDLELFENLEEIWIRLGRQPVNSDLRQSGSESKFSANTYSCRFSSWNKTLLAFAAWANDQSQDNDRVSTERAPSTKKTPRDINLRLRSRVMQRDGFTCRGCGRSPATTPGTILHADHIVPWSKGGLTEIANLQTLCSNCNLGKGNVI